MWKTGKFTTLVLALQIVLIILFAVYVEYDENSDVPKSSKTSTKANNVGNDSASDEAHKEEHSDPVHINDYYPLFQDVHIMMFIGFGYLMTFLKRYGLSAVGLNFLISALVIQWATFMQGIHAGHYVSVKVNVVSMLGADFSAAAVLISFGAVLGKTSPVQLVVMAMIEIAIFASNEHLGLHVFKVIDIGGSMFVHVFGAYFGLGAALMLYKKPQRDNPKNGSNYNSDIFAMIGAIFLWMCWPSFNSALALGADRHRAIINTYFALSACVLSSFALSQLVGKGKFDMVHIQNATLAGGVAIGTSANLLVQPYGALLIGTFAGLLSVVGYKYIQPFLEKRCRLHDTCGVHNLHGLPGVMAGLLGALMSFMATEEEYGKHLYAIFPARVPEANSTLYSEITNAIGPVDASLGRSSQEQAIYQLIALGVTFLIAVISGILTGAILRLPIFDPVDEDDLFEDEQNWELGDEDPSEYETKDTNNVGHYMQDETSKV